MRRRCSVKVSPGSSGRRSSTTHYLATGSVTFFKGRHRRACYYYIWLCLRYTTNAFDGFRIVRLVVKKFNNNNNNDDSNNNNIHFHGCRREDPTTSSWPARVYTHHTAAVSAMRASRREYARKITHDKFSLSRRTSLLPRPRELLYSSRSSSPTDTL